MLSMLMLVAWMEGLDGLLAEIMVKMGGGIYGASMKS